MKDNINLECNKHDLYKGIRFNYKRYCYKCMKDFISNDVAAFTDDDLSTVDNRLVFRFNDNWYIDDDIDTLVDDIYEYLYNDGFFNGKVYTLR